VALGTVLSALLLSSCGNGAPGVAAAVGDSRISDQEVDDFAKVLCSLGAVQGTEAGTPTRSARFRSLQILLGDELAEDMTDTSTADKRTVNAILTQMNATRDTVPSSLTSTYDQVAKQFAQAQTAMIELGRASLIKQGKSPAKITDDAAYAEGDRLRTEYAKSQDIDVDPRYGVIEDGRLRPSDGSLSVPVSDLARKGTASVTTPDGSVVGQLPPSQKCS
jgi:hypothetical protein